MSNRVVLQEKLAFIMETFANAAVAEICKLVDDGYAVLCLEISERQKENDDLKMKLKMMEQMTVQEFTEISSVKRKYTINNHIGDVQVSDKIRGLKEHESQAEDVRSVKALGGSIHKDEGSPSKINMPTSMQPVVGMDKCADTKERKPDSLLIKEEKLEEAFTNGSQNGVLNTTRLQTVRQLGSSPAELCAAPACLLEKPAEREESRCSEQEANDSDVLLKAELEKESITDMLQCEQLENRTDGPNHLSLGTLLQTIRSPGCRTAVMEGDGHGHGQQCLDIQSEVQPADKGAVALPSLGSSTTKADAVQLNSIPMEYVLHSAWNNDPNSGMVPLHHRQYGEEQKTTGLTNMSPSHAPVTAASTSYGSDINGFMTAYKHFTARETEKTNFKLGTRNKLFMCKYCGKCCTRSGNLKRHQRVHTGEKPFGCTQCGKKFTQSCSLKRHQSVHIGEKPFSCSQCGKKLSDLNSLRKHQCLHWKKTL